MYAHLYVHKSVGEKWESIVGFRNSYYFIVILLYSDCNEELRLSVTMVSPFNVFGAVTVVS